VWERAKPQVPCAPVLLYQGPTLVGPLRPNKDLGFSPCVNCLHKQFLQYGQWQGLKPNLFQLSAARLKSGPDTKHRRAEWGNSGFFCASSHTALPVLGNSQSSLRDFFHRYGKLRPPETSLIT
jgi:hypothetical protein